MLMAALCNSKIWKQPESKSTVECINKLGGYSYGRENKWITTACSDTAVSQEQNAKYYKQVTEEYKIPFLQSSKMQKADDTYF